MAIWVLWLGYSTSVIVFGLVVLVSSLWVNPWCRDTFEAADSPGVGFPYFSEWPFGPGCYVPGAPARPPSWWWTAELLILTVSGAVLWSVHHRVRHRRDANAQQR